MSARILKSKTKNSMWLLYFGGLLSLSSSRPPPLALDQFRILLKGTNKGKADFSVEKQWILKHWLRITF